MSFHTGDPRLGTTTTEAAPAFALFESWELMLPLYAGRGEPQHPPFAPTFARPEDGTPPVSPKMPAPIFLGMNFSGNHSLVADTNVPVTTAWMLPELHNVVDGHATEAGRGQEADTWALEQSIDRGYAVATYFCGEVEEDRTNAVGGVREMIQVARAPDAWGTIAAWAWELLDRVVRPAPRPARRGGRGHLGQSGRGLRHVASGRRGVSFDGCRGPGRVRHARDQPID